MISGNKMHNNFVYDTEFNGKINSQYSVSTFVTRGVIIV